MSNIGWVARLLCWYDEHRRELPWRDEPTPYRVWVSEIMLQQTQVETVKPYFARFIDAFPTVDALAVADEQAILRLWQGLGYYSRARRLHAAAKLVVQERGGRLPESYEELLTIPGLGPYTAAAIASIAFGQPIPVVDGNVLRLHARFTGMRDDITRQQTKQAVFDALLPAIADAPPSDFNQAMMELGALVCRPRNPTCLLCPMQENCVARREGLIDELPVKAKRKAIPHHQLAVGLIRRGDQLLIVQRPAGGMLERLWELPGGQRHDGESAEAAVERILREEYGLKVQAGASIGSIQHAYSHFQITTAVCPAVLTAGAGADATWIVPEQLSTYPFHTAALKALELASFR